MHPTFVQTPIHYTLEEFAATLARYANSLWRPAFPTLHNTGVPSLAQWTAMGATPQERWGANLNRYYTGLGWHAGPHLVVCPDYIWVLSDLAQPGVSVSCWNTKTIGIEMVGNFEIGGDDFDSGLGAKVRDNAERALTLIANLFHWGDLSDYSEGERGLHFHRECARDHHACPGSKVNKQLILERVEKLRHAIIAGSNEQPEMNEPAKSTQPTAISADSAIKSVQSELSALDANTTLQIDGIFGPATHAAVIAFQKKHDLVDDWEPGSRTRALLSELAAHTIHS